MIRKTSLIDTKELHYLYRAVLIILDEVIFFHYINAPEQTECRRQGHNVTIMYLKYLCAAVYVCFRLFRQFCSFFPGSRVFTYMYMCILKFICS